MKKNRRLKPTTANRNTSNEKNITRGIQDKIEKKFTGLREFKLDFTLTDSYQIKSLSYSIVSHAGMVTVYKGTGGASEESHWPQNAEGRRQGRPHEAVTCVRGHESGVSGRDG